MQRKITPRSEKLKQLGGFKPVTHIPSFWETLNPLLNKISGAYILIPID